jgi:hypothetical protein
MREGREVDEEIVRGDVLERRLIRAVVGKRGREMV